MKVSIIIPNYNGEQLLIKNLPKVIEAANFYKEKSSIQIEVIIVDDDSTDNSVKYIKDQISKIKNTPKEFLQNSTGQADQKSKIRLILLQNEKNLGFASTVNNGVREVEGDIVVLLNTDVVPQKDFLAPLLEHFKDERVFAVGCMDKSIEDGKVALRGRGIGKWERGFLVHNRGEIDKTNTLWVNGGSGAFRKSIWEKLGGFDKLYSPFYWEDIDLSYRALKSGYKILFEPKSIVIHEHEKGAIKQKYSPFRIKTIAYRNQFIFVWKNATDLNLQFSHLFWLPYHFAKALSKFDLAFLYGFFQALVLLLKIVKLSLKSQRYFVKKDIEIVSNFIK